MEASTQETEHKLHSHHCGESIVCSSKDPVLVPRVAGVRWWGSERMELSAGASGLWVVHSREKADEGFVQRSAP